MALKESLVGTLLGLALLSAWLGTLGFLRLRTELARLHCTTFMDVAAGAALFVAVAIQDGATSRTLKTLLLLPVVLIIGAATNHAVGRTIFLRDGAKR